MSSKSEVITYNVHERGRQSRGIDRSFDLAALGRLVRSPEVQERVKQGDLMGYLGHWPRLVFGMAMCEGGIHQGKAIALEPAVRTVMLTADDEGNITHQQEFLDTKSGQVAAGIYKSKAGGFSSAIEAVPNSLPALPLDFHGFDFVYEPNYATNRGYEPVLDGVMLDSALAGSFTPGQMVAMLDAVASESTGAAHHLSMLLDSMSAQQQQTLEALERVCAENEELIAAAARGAKAQAMLDAAQPGYGLNLNGPTIDDYSSFGSVKKVVTAPVASIKPNANPILRGYGL